MTPRRILPSEPDHQLTDDGRNARTTSGWFRLRRVGPTPCDQLPVPTKQRLRRYDPRPQQLARQHPGKPGQHEAVLRVQPRTTHLPTQHRNLMPQHQQLDVLRRLATAAGHDESKQHPEGRIHSAEQHPNDHAEPSKHTRPRFLSPTGEPDGPWIGDEYRFDRRTRHLSHRRARRRG